MRLKKIIKLAWNILVHSKLRSWLTIIGIIIGIAAVVSIVSISQGAQQSLAERFGDLGADIITISPGFSQASGFRRPGGTTTSETTADQEDLTDKDILALKSVPNVKFVMGKVTDRGEVEYLGEGGELSITGVDTNVWKDIETDKLEAGRYLTKGDIYAAVIGYTRAHDYFDKEVQINRQITIEGRIFKVVGIFAEGENDNGIIIPEDAARNVLEDIDENEYSSISVKVEDVNKVNITTTDIEKKLMLTRGILKQEDKDFTVLSVIELQRTITDTLKTMSIFLGAIAAISLVVGAVGISNTMFTSVLEKTKEIGIMKAIGAKNSDIMLIFLINSGMIGFVGGLGGVIIGSIASGSIGLLIGGGEGGISRMFGTTAITPELLIYSFLFSIIIGMIAGAIPAYRASKLKPVDALRYE